MPVMVFKSFRECGEIQGYVLRQTAEAVAGIVIRAGLGAGNTAAYARPMLVLHRLDVTIEGQAHQADDDLPEGLRQG